MISFCILTRNNENLDDLYDMIYENCPCEFEVCIGDNSSDPDCIDMAREFSDEYIKITDKELFRGGIPRAHNRIAIECANTYKIFYIDTDEFPVWINPKIEEKLSLNYVLPALRFDFLTMEEIEDIHNKDLDYFDILDLLDRGDLEKNQQDRIYNARYAKFEGLCHSIFHVPEHFRSSESGTILLHNKEIRNKKNKTRMDALIHEQYARQNINPLLSSSKMVYSWGRGKKHKYKNWKEWNNAF